MSYFKEYTESLGSNFSSIKSITNFTNNTDVIGLYAEKLVIEFLKKLVFPLNISTGSIISEEDYNNGNKQLSQIDIIIWDPNPLPPIFHMNEFALIPKKSVLGILEIKKSDYDKGLKDIQDRYDNRSKLLPEHCLNEKYDNFFAIIGVAEYHKINGKNELSKLIENTNNKTHCLVTYNSEKTNFEINHKSVLELINFVGKLKILHKQLLELDNIFEIDISKTGL